MNDQKTSSTEKPKPVAILVYPSRIKEFDAVCRRKGRSRSDVVRRLMDDLVARDGSDQNKDDDVAVKLEWHASRAENLVPQIHHMDRYMKKYRELGGDTEEFSNADKIIQELRLIAAEPSDREDCCDQCHDETFMAVVSGSHLELDYTFFEDYVLAMKEYQRLKRIMDLNPRGH